MKDYKALMREVDEILTERQPEGIPEYLTAPVLMGMARETLPVAPEGAKPAYFESFNQFTGGFRKNCVTILCGMTGSGKTTFCANLAAFLLYHGHKSFVLSAELGPLQFFRAMMSAWDGTDYASQTNVSLDRLTQFESQWAKTVGKDGFYISPYEMKVNPRQVLCDLLYAQSELGCEVAFIDNLNFVMPIVEQDRANANMDKTIHDFIVFCKAVPMHVVLIMHPKKTESGRVVSEFDVKGSSGVVQEATNVLLWNRPSKEDQQLYPASNHRELILAKLRYTGAHQGKRIIFENVGGAYSEKAVL